MANYSERSRRRRFGHWVAIAAGILLVMIGIYLIVSVSGNTDRENADCTAETTGTVTESQPSDSGYSTTVEYTPGFNPMTVTLNTEKQYDAGTEVTVKYNPTSFTKVYIEGMSSTGKNDSFQGMVFILAGILLSALGVLVGRFRQK